MKSAAQSRRKKCGNRGELLVAQLMRANGFQFIEPVNDSWKPIAPVKDPKTGKPKGGQWICFKCSGNLSGDIRAVKAGRSVLVEVKSTQDDRLQYSKLQVHQRKSLTVHHLSGGMSYLGWAAPHGTYLIRWPVGGFQPRTSLTAIQAAGLAECKWLAAIHPANRKDAQTNMGGEVDEVVGKAPF